MTSSLVEKLWITIMKCIKRKKCQFAWYAVWSLIRKGDRVRKSDTGFVFMQQRLCTYRREFCMCLSCLYTDRCDAMSVKPFSTRFKISQRRFCAPRDPSQCPQTYSSRLTSMTSKVATCIYIFCQKTFSKLISSTPNLTFKWLWCLGFRFSFAL